MVIIFKDTPTGSALSGLRGLTVEIGYTEMVYCENPVVVDESTADELVVMEADDAGEPIDHTTWAIPIEAIHHITVL